MRRQKFSEAEIKAADARVTLRYIASGIDAWRFGGAEDPDAHFAKKRIIKVMF
jgi:hypothetical protein